MIAAPLALVGLRITPYRKWPEIMHLSRKIEVFCSSQRFSIGSFSSGRPPFCVSKQTFPPTPSSQVPSVALRSSLRCDLRARSQCRMSLRSAPASSKNILPGYAGTRPLSRAPREVYRGASSELRLLVRLRFNFGYGPFGANHPRETAASSTQYSTLMLSITQQKIEEQIPWRIHCQHKTYDHRTCRLITLSCRKLPGETIEPGQTAPGS